MYSAGNLITENPIGKQKKNKRGKISMDKIILYIIAFVGGGLGVLSSLYIVAATFGVLGYKIYRKAKYHISLFK